ncbi:MAG: WecB/TagA/CpsF family glycosyltransferase [Actinomycetota bacterium]|nr:WecB/TagA/CpsF family glycosyltransferase [Actinomycetota bacterium]
MSARASDAATPDSAVTLPRIAAEKVLGIPLSVTNYEQTLDWIEAMIATRRRGYVCVSAVHTVMAAQEDRQLRAAVLSADLTVPDGQPLVWALNALGHSLKSRVYGPDLMWKACARAARNGTRFFFYGGRDPEALQTLVSRLEAAHPGLQIAGNYCPPFRALTPEEECEVIDQIERSGAHVVWVGIGVPKQEKWMATMRPRLNTPVLVGVGAAFDFHAGLVPQAPDWMQERGLEWLFRLKQEPRRLWKRYLRYNPAFVVGFVRQYGRHRRARQRRR